VADTFTAKLALRKPDPVTLYDVTKVNANNQLIDDAMGAVICTSATRPSTGLFNGLQIYETDTGLSWVRSAGAWAMPRLTFSTTVRPTLGLFNGFTIYRSDKGFYEVYNGTVWRVCEWYVAVAALADITDPRVGQMALLTTDLWEYRWSGSAWLAIRSTGAVPGGEWLITGAQTIPTAGADSKITATSAVQGTAVNCSYTTGVLTLSAAGVWQVEFALEVTNATSHHWAWLSDNTGTPRYCGSAHPGGLYSGSFSKSVTSGTTMALWAWAELASDLVPGRNACRIQAYFRGYK
jgi:hypothetical protein